MRFRNCVRITTLLAILTLAAGSPAAAPVQQPAPVAATVTTDVVPHDRTTSQFVADLTRDDFELYEDGVRQELTSLEVVQAVTLLKDVLRTVIRDGDMFGIVSTGTSSISQQLTSERSILESLQSRPGPANTADRDPHTTTECRCDPSALTLTAAVTPIAVPTAIGHILHVSRSPSRLCVLCGLA
jgi:hypothetical protein